MQVTKTWSRTPVGNLVFADLHTPNKFDQYSVTLTFQDRSTLQPMIDYYESVLRHCLETAGSPHVVESVRVEWMDRCYFMVKTQRLPYEVRVSTAIRCIPDNGSIRTRAPSNHTLYVTASKSASKVDSLQAQVLCVDAKTKRPIPATELKSGTQGVVVFSTRLSFMDYKTGSLTIDKLNLPASLLGFTKTSNFSQEFLDSERKALLDFATADLESGESSEVITPDYSKSSADDDMPF